MPTVVIRTSGCTHRCYFGEGGWCDSWYTSIHPEKSLYDIEDVKQMYKDNPQIKEMMITGGSPTMHPKLLQELTQFAKENGIVTTIETEGSHYVETDHPIDLISLSPKLSNSVPVLGAVTPKGKVVDEKFIKQHNKFRMNIDTMKQMLEYHTDYQLKPVWGGGEEALQEIRDLVKELGIPNNKVWMMPAGDTREQLVKMYPVVMEQCIEEGWNFTGRPHIIAYQDQREV
jgi:7-carboxy-7-deazaguanine synthase